MIKTLNEELGRVSVDTYKELDKLPIIVVAENIRSLNNIGSLFRTADAFLIESIYLCGISATPPNKEIHKTALGAELSVDWKYYENSIDAVQFLKYNGYTIIAIEQVHGSIMLDKFEVDNTKKYALILGNEVKGVSQAVVDLCDMAIEIPQKGTKHSLNVSVANGVVLWHFSQRL
ncbi:MAG: RNA methyltransferase [Rikenellaceae bacterium]